MKAGLYIHTDGTAIMDKQAVADYIKSLPHGYYTLEIKKRGQKRSDSQNEYYWGLVIEMIREYINEQSGEQYSAEDVHELLKSKFNTVYNPLVGEFIPKSTTKLNTSEFEEYLQKIRTWGESHLGLKIPLPNEI